MEWFFSIPALVKILCVFGLVLFLNRLRFQLSICLFAGSLTLGVWMGLGPMDLIRSAAGSLTELQTLCLLFIVGSILVISRLMAQSGHLDRIVSNFSKMSRDERTAGAVMPALIGLLPMPGGALFSAPMVETAFCGNRAGGDAKTAVNYWFRHIWEYWWPLYPGVVLAVALLGVQTWQFMAVMAPMTAVTVAAGVIFILRPIGGGASLHEKAGPTWRGIGMFLWEIMPILIVVFTIAGLAMVGYLAGLAGCRFVIPGPVSVLPGLLLSMIWVCAVNRVSFHQFGSAVAGKGILTMLLLVAAVMVFKGIMADSQAVSQIRDEFVSHHVPLALIIIAMPFLSGFITGIAIGFVGTSFPLIIPLFQTGNSFEYLTMAALAYTFGYMGMMLSPVHLCFLVSKDFFKASLLQSYRRIIIPALVVMGTAAVFFMVLRAFR